MCFLYARGTERSRMRLAFRTGPFTDVESPAQEREARRLLAQEKKLVVRDMEQPDVLIYCVAAVVLRPCLPAQP
jgi:hypothetical protein